MMLFEQIEFWYWWVIAVFFFAIEVFAPGAFFLFVGVGATVVGLLLLALPQTGLELQLLTFAVVSVVSAFGWRVYQKRHPPPETDQPALNRRGTQYIGRTFTLTEAIVNGQGKLRVDDTIWKVEGSDMPEGTQVRVTGVEGTTLTVEAAK